MTGTIMKRPKLWCVQGPSGRLMTGTLDLTRDGALFKLFEFMPESFRKTHWKNFALSKRSYKKLGYKAVKVEITPVK